MEYTVCQSLESSSILFTSCLAWKSNLKYILGKVFSEWYPNGGSSYYLGILYSSPSYAWRPFQSFCCGISWCDWYGIPGSGYGPACCVGGWCSLLFMNWVRCCHWETVGVLLMEGSTVSKKFSCWIWYCGDTMAVSRFVMSDIKTACLGGDSR